MTRTSNEAMARNTLRWILIALFVAECVRAPREKGGETLSSQIILINGGTVDRCQMAVLIQSVSECNPKAIGINFLFIDEINQVCDSLLQQAIVDADKVVLVEGYNDEGIVKSNKIFSDAAFLTGPTGLSQSENGLVDYYYRLTDNNGKWAYSFPFLLALQYDNRRGSELAAKSFPKDYPIVFYNDLEDFKNLAFESKEHFNCDSLKEKIVIVGYLGPDKEDLQSIPKAENLADKMYGTVIIANIILDILKSLEMD